MVLFAIKNQNRGPRCSAELESGRLSLVQRASVPPAGWLPLQGSRAWPPRRATGKKKVRTRVDGTLQAKAKRARFTFPGTIQQVLHIHSPSTAIPRTAGLRGGHKWVHRRRKIPSTWHTPSLVTCSAYCLLLGIPGLLPSRSSSAQLLHVVYWLTSRRWWASKVKTNVTKQWRTVSQGFGTN